MQLTGKIDPLLIKRPSLRDRRNKDLKLKIESKPSDRCSETTIDSSGGTTLTHQKRNFMLSPGGIVKREQVEGDFEDNFEMLELLGQGAHASVYKCCRKNTTEVYAVKIMKHHDEELAKMAENQFKILRSLSHPNIVKTS